MISESIVAVILEHEDCVEYVREVVGNNDPEKIKKGIIRKLYADRFKKNALHASDSAENARRGIEIMFGHDNI